MSCTSSRHRKKTNTLRPLPFDSCCIIQENLLRVLSEEKYAREERLFLISEVQDNFYIPLDEDILYLHDQESDFSFFPSGGLRMR